MDPGRGYVPDFPSNAQTSSCASASGGIVGERGASHAIPVASIVHEQSSSGVVHVAEIAGHLVSRREQWSFHAFRCVFKCVGVWFCTFARRSRIGADHARLQHVPLAFSPFGKVLVRRDEIVRHQRHRQDSIWGPILIQL